LKPLVAIGGITAGNAPAVFEAGADSVAVIADLLPDPATSGSLRHRMEEWQAIANR
jgi:thiamine monophosphate synthase